MLKGLITSDEARESEAVKAGAGDYRENAGDLAELIAACTKKLLTHKH